MNNATQYAFLQTALVTQLLVLGCSAVGIYNRELVVNGGAESTSGIGGWTVVQGTPVNIQYGQGANPISSPSGCSQCASAFFRGTGASDAEMTQTIDLASIATPSELLSIDTGTIQVTLSCWLGGWGLESDRGVIAFSFLDGTAASLGSATSFTVSQSDRSSQTTLLSRSTVRTIRNGSRRIDVTYLCVYGSGSQCNGYVDVISVKLTSPQCSCGTVCPSGTSCPAGSYCAASFGTFSGFPCRAGDYCPSGSCAPADCAAGSYCSTSSVSVMCGSGSYCPAKSTVEADCAAGDYCTTPSVKALCPAGSYCPTRTVVPVQCASYFYCGRPGMVAPSMSPSGSRSAELSRSVSFSGSDSSSRSHSVPSSVALSRSVSLSRCGSTSSVSVASTLSMNNSESPSFLSTSSRLEVAMPSDSESPAETPTLASTWSVDPPGKTLPSSLSDAQCCPRSRTLTCHLSTSSDRFSTVLRTVSHIADVDRCHMETPVFEVRATRLDCSQVACGEGYHQRSAQPLVPLLVPVGVNIVAIPFDVLAQSSNVVIAFNVSVGWNIVRIVSQGADLMPINVTNVTIVSANYTPGASGKFAEVLLPSSYVQYYRSRPFAAQQCELRFELSCSGSGRIAVAPVALFIRPRPLPIPPALDTAVRVAQAVSTMSGERSAMSMGRLSSSLLLLQCGDAFGDDWSGGSVIPINAGDGVVNTVTGNLVFVIACGIGLLIIGFLLALVTVGCQNIFSNYCNVVVNVLRFPTVMFVFLASTLGSSLTAVTVYFSDGPSRHNMMTPLLLVISALLVWGGYVIAVLAFALWIFRSGAPLTLTVKGEDTLRQRATVLVKIFARRKRWVVSNGGGSNHRILLLLAPLLEDVTVLWYPPLDCSATVVSSIVTALPTSGSMSSCVWVASLLLSVNALMFAVTVKQIFTRTVHNVCNALLQLCIVGCSAAALGAITAGATTGAAGRWVTAAQYLAAAATAATLIRALVDTALLIVTVRRALHSACEMKPVVHFSPRKEEHEDSNVSSLMDILNANCDYEVVLEDAGDPFCTDPHRNHLADVNAFDDNERNESSMLLSESPIDVPMESCPPHPGGDVVENCVLLELTSAYSHSQLAL